MRKCAHKLEKDAAHYRKEEKTDKKKHDKAKLKHHKIEEKRLAQPLKISAPVHALPMSNFLQSCIEDELPCYSYKDYAEPLKRLMVMAIADKI